MSKTIAIIDLDTPIYKVAAACEERSILVKHSPTGIEKSFSTRTEFKELLKKKDKLDALEDYEIEDVQEPEPIENALHLLKNQVDKILESLWADDAVFLLSGSTNFRNDLPLPTKYKSTRSNIRPLLLKEVRAYAKKKFNAIESTNSEPDDSQIWMGYDYQNKGYKPIVVSSDKDSKAYSGLFLFNPDKPEQGVVEIPKLGTIEVDSKNKVRAWGMMQYGLQMKIGDITDSYRPTELCKVKYGEKSAYKALVNCKTEQEVLQSVIEQYKKWYPEDFIYTAWNGKKVESNWKHMLSLFHKCVRMQEVENDPLIAYDFYKRFGVELT